MVKFDLLMKGGRVCDPLSGKITEEDIAIKEGKISLRGKGLEESEAETVFPAQGCVIAPGLIDMHCHIFRCFLIHGKILCVQRMQKNRCSNVG